MAAFLTVAGLTGSILAFSDELDAWLNPELYRAKTSGALLPPSDLAKAVEAIDPRVVAVWIPLKVAPGESALVWVSTLHDPKTGEHYDVGFNQVFVEPSTGEVLGTRNWGAFSLRRENLIDTEEPAFQKQDIPADLDPALREGRTIDGSHNDLSYPQMGSCGRRFGRNVPLAHAHPDFANLMTPSPRVES